MKIKSELVRFAIMFSVLVVLLLVIFYFIFPYYRIGLKYVVLGLFSLFGIKANMQSVMLDYMPYVSLSALVLATPRKGLKEKLKTIMFASIFFFFIDIIFSIIQISIPTYSKDILLIQELLVISLPIIIWWYFAHLIFKNENNEQLNTDTKRAKEPFHLVKSA